MPTPSLGRESRRSSKSGPSGDEAYKSSERREKAKSSQSFDGKRRGSKQAESSLSTVPERPGLKGRTNSAPLVEARITQPGSWDTLEDGPQTSKSSSTPKIGAGSLGDAQDEDEVAGVVGAVRHFQPFQSPELLEPLPDINIAIVGGESVGKSTFIQKALDLEFLAPSQAVERKMPIDGKDYLVRLLELPIDDVDIDDDDNTVSWPETIESKMMPKIDGTLTLYDVKDKSSLEGIPELLNAISNTGLPSVLISCKCDSPLNERQVDPSTIEQTAKRSLKHLNTVQTSAGTPETYQRGISIVLRAIVSRSSDDHIRSTSTTRRRAQSNTVRSVSPRPPGGVGHARATSEYTGGLQKDLKHGRHDSSMAAYGSSDRLKAPGAKSQEKMHGSFLFEESASESSPESTRSSVDAMQHATSGSQPPTQSSEPGATFDELVDRLLAQPLSKTDSKFSMIFLALYRKFAAPGRLLEAIVERFDGLDRDGGAQILKTVSQLRYLAILQQWVGSYPGDFAFPRTKWRMRTFVGKLSQSRICAVAAMQMNTDLDVVQDDDDTDWAYNDKDRASSGADIRTSLSSTASTLIDDPSFPPTDELQLTDSTSTSTLQEDASEVPTGGETVRSMSATSTQIMVNIESAQRQANLLQPTSRQLLSKMQWHLLMDYPDDTIARELTRMDWIMFSSIRPRDLVRQVSLSDAQKANCKNLAHVNRMINHFNQLASWAANYILLRDKPKHRAMMLEKFMRVARKLREMNNYNALGAIVAGIRSSAVYRLTATRELVPPSVSKDWLKLEILMSPTRSHFAYRLAWENSSSERVPYLPLHRRDLVSAEEGNKTFVGDEKDGKINWKKFEIMGEVIVSMQRAQGMPYKGLGAAKGNEQVKELVLDFKLTKDEDDLFERSKQVEPTGSTGGGTSTKFKEFFKR